MGSCTFYSGVDNRLATQLVIIVKRTRICVLLSVAIFLSTIGSASAASGGWWNDAWSYRTTLTIDPGAYDRWDYPIEITADFSSFVDAGAIIDPNSVRVVRSGQEIPCQYTPLTAQTGELIFVYTGKIEQDTLVMVDVYFDVGDEKVEPDYDTFSVDFAYGMTYEEFIYVWGDAGFPVGDPDYPSFLFALGLLYEVFSYFDEAITVENFHELLFESYMGVSWDYVDGYINQIGMGVEELRSLESDQCKNWLLTESYVQTVLMDIYPVLDWIGADLEEMGTSIDFTLSDGPVKFLQSISVTLNVSSSYPLGAQLWHYTLSMYTYDKSGKVFIEAQHDIDDPQLLGTLAHDWYFTIGGNGFSRNGDTLYLDDGDGTQHTYYSPTLTSTNIQHDNTNFFCMWDTDNTTSWPDYMEYSAPSEVLGVVFDNSSTNGMRDLSFAPEGFFGGLGVRATFGYLGNNGYGFDPYVAPSTSVENLTDTAYMLEFHNKEGGVDPWNRTQIEFLSYNSPATVTLASSPRPSTPVDVGEIVGIVLALGAIALALLLFWYLMNRRRGREGTPVFQTREDAIAECERRGLTREQCVVESENGFRILGD